MKILLILEEDEEWPPANTEGPDCWEMGPNHMEFRVYGEKAEEIYGRLCGINRPKS